MHKSTSQPVPADVSVDAKHPIRTLMTLLRPARWRVVAAIAAFVVKDSPTWLLPVLTANVIDVVVSHRPIRLLWINVILLAVVLLQNIPMHILWVRLSSRLIRRLGMDLRSGLTSHLQRLSIGFHSRVGASLLQTKVVRDVESVEQMLQQVGQAGTSAVFVLAGALILTAVRVPEFVPLFLLIVPFTAALIATVRKRSAFSKTSRTAWPTSTRRSWSGPCATPTRTASCHRCRMGGKRRSASEARACPEASGNGSRSLER